MALYTQKRSHCTAGSCSYICSCYIYCSHKITTTRLYSVMLGITYKLTVNPATRMLCMVKVNLYCIYLGWLFTPSWLPPFGYFFFCGPVQTLLGLLSPARVIHIIGLRISFTQAKRHIHIKYANDIRWGVSSQVFTNESKLAFIYLQRGCAATDVVTIVIP